MKHTYRAALAAALLLSGCAGPAVVTTDDSARPDTATTAAPPPTTGPATNALLVDASEYASRVDGRVAGYFFTSPSGRWSCAIVPRRHAGCQSAAGSALGIDGAPTMVRDADGELAAPTAIVIGRTGEARFEAPSEPGFRLDSGSAAELAFDRILAAAGFRCNVQEQSGVSCLSEASGEGFTFAADGYTPSYTDVAGP